MYQDILLPLDLNNVETQQKALRAAVDLAKTYKARLHIMTVVPDFGAGVVSSFFPEDYEQKAVEEASQRMHEFVAANVPKGMQVQHIVAHGGIYEEILRSAAATKVDLIVMASHRPELSDYLLGPNAARVVRHATCSVLVVRD